MNSYTVCENVSNLDELCKKISEETELEYTIVIKNLPIVLKNFPIRDQNILRKYYLGRSTIRQIMNDLSDGSSATEILREVKRGTDDLISSFMTLRRTNMINRVQKELVTLATISGKDFNQDMSVIDVSSWKDEEMNLHTFVYSVKEGDATKIKFHLSKIYSVFVNDELTKEFWKDLIDNFEERYDIDFFVLISFMYMINTDHTDRNIRVVSQVSHILMREYMEK